MPEDHPPEPYLHARRLRFASWASVAAWLLLVVLLLHAVLPASPLDRGQFSNLLVVFLAISAAYGILAFGLRCPRCGQRFLVQRPGPKHPDAAKLVWTGYWAAAIVGVLRRGECRCMYCGERIRAR